MFSRNHAALALCPVAALVVGCGTGSSSGSNNQAKTRAVSGLASESPRDRVGATPSAPTRGIATAIAVAKHIYNNEITGVRARGDMRLLASDQALLHDLSRGQLAAAQAEAFRQMTSHRTEHITRVSVERGRRLLINAVWNNNGSFVVAPLAQGLDINGRRFGTLLVSIQDVIGYVKLVHIYTGAQVAVRGASGQVRASLTAATHTRLPSSGYLTLSGRRYAAGTFHLRGWGGELLTVSVLKPA